MHGYFLFSSDFLDRLRPDAHARIANFMNEGENLSITLVKDRGYVVNERHELDHPDFDVEDARYDLVIERYRNAEEFHNPEYRLKALLRWDGAKWVTVKEYVS